MPSTKIAITLERSTLAKLDRLVTHRVFANRSRAIQIAVAEKLARMEGSRLAAECAKLDPHAEGQFADEGLGEDAASWPAY